MNSIITYLQENNAEAFFALAQEYLGSSPEQLQKKASDYPHAFLALMQDSALIGIAFGWPHIPNVPGEAPSFGLAGLAINSTFQRRGYGSELLQAWEKHAKEYGFPTITVGSAGGYVERFYIKNGYTPIQYKIYVDGVIRLAKTFPSPADYYHYTRPKEEGFVVLEKRP